MVFAFKIAGAAAEEGVRPRRGHARGPRGCRTRCVRSAWRSAPAPCCRRGNPRSASARTRWRSAWASMASPACGAAPLTPGRRDRRRDARPAGGRPLPSSPGDRGLAPWSTASAPRRPRSCTSSTARCMRGWPMPGCAVVAPAGRALRHLDGDGRACRSPCACSTTSCERLAARAVRLPVLARLTWRASRRLPPWPRALPGLAAHMSRGARRA